MQRDVAFEPSPGDRAQHIPVSGTRSQCIRAFDNPLLQLRGAVPANVHFALIELDFGRLRRVPDPVVFIRAVGHDSARAETAVFVVMQGAELHVAQDFAGGGVLCERGGATIAEEEITVGELLG